jgi:hypothetical protein
VESGSQCARARGAVSCSLVGLLPLLGDAVHAQLPLSIEELQVDARVLKLEIGSAVGVSEQLVVDSAARPEAAGQATALPVYAQRERQALVSYGGLRYGVRPGFEVNGMLRGSWSQLPDGFSTNRERHAASIVLGASYQVLPDTGDLAVLASLSVDALARDSTGAGDWEMGRNWRAGATLWRALEPLVLSLDLGLDYRLERRWEGRRLAPGHSVQFSPRVNFAVNEQVTLISGLQLQWTTASRIEGDSVGRGSGRIGLLLGAGLAPGPRTTLFVQGRLASGAAGSAGVSLDWRYRL